MRKLSYSIVLGAFLSTSLISCSKFMERDTYDSVGADFFFERETDLELYANGLIQDLTPSATEIGYSDMYADYCAVQIPHDLLRVDGNISPENQGGWTEGSWSGLRSINYFLANLPKIKGKISDELYNHYEGVGRFWRGYFYFNKVKTFGAVPFYDKVIESSDQEALFKPKDSREFVMDKVLEDLLFASDNCLGTEKFRSSGTKINKWIAAAITSRIALFEGTYRRYHPVDPSTAQPWQNREAQITKFLNAAVYSADLVMKSGLFGLVEGNPETAYRSLFTSEKLNLKEIIWGREYSKALAVLHDVTWMYFSPTAGSRASMTKTFVNTYLTLDGTPFTSLANYKTKTFKDEFENRDYRLMQTVISPSYQMTRNNVKGPYSPNWLVSRTGYHPIKFSLDTDADNVTARASSWNSLPIIRYAEVLLNYAEAKAELGSFTTADWDNTIKLIRNRAGVKSVYPTTADSYLSNYFKGTVTNPVILEIRRERGTELCLEMGLRYSDIMRWHMGALLSSAENPWTGIYIPDVTQKYDFNNDGTIDFQVGAVESTNTINVGSSGANQTFSRNADGNLVWNYQRVWAEYKYLRPIPLEAITRNPALEQNELWKK